MPLTLECSLLPLSILSALLCLHSFIAVHVCAYETCFSLTHPRLIYESREGGLQA